MFGRRKLLTINFYFPFLSLAKHTHKAMHIDSQNSVFLYILQYFSIFFLHFLKFLGICIEEWRGKYQYRG